MLATLFAIIASLGLYPKSGIVTNVNETADTVTVRDCNGFEWQFKGTEDWMYGDGVAMIMYDNHTEIIFDDEIVTVRYERR